jgi:hypothetical protein
MTGTVFFLRCACGREHEYGLRTTLIECPCGAVYAVTTSELRPPNSAGDGAGDETDGREGC